MVAVTRHTAGQRAMWKKVAAAAAFEGSKYIARKSGQYLTQKGKQLGKKYFDKWRSVTKGKGAVRKIKSFFERGSTSGSAGSGGRHPPRNQLRSKLAMEFNGLGMYKGRITPKKGDVKGISRYNFKGTVFRKELTGSIQDPDVLYICNSVMNAYDCCRQLTLTLIRHVLELANLRVSGLDDVINTDICITGSLNFLLVLGKKNVSSATTTTTSASINGATLNGLLSSFLNEFLNYSSGYDNVSGNGNTLNNVVLTGFTLICSGSAGDDYPVATINFSECTVDMFGSSELKVQNRSKSNTGSEDEMNVGNNPLQGKCYLFKGLPKVRTQSESFGGGQELSLFETQPVTDGVKTLLGASFPAGMRDPVEPNAFRNCKKAGSFKLDAGHIHSFYVREKLKMNVLTFLKKMRIQYGTATLYNTSYTMFKTQMIAYEDLINVNSTSQIALAFEVERTTGMKITSRKKGFCKTWFNQVAL